MDDPGGQDTPFACCLCGARIAKGGADPGELVYTPDDGDGGTQVLWCHVECLRKAVVKGTPLIR